MNFRIADTFTASLARLTGAEQKAAKTTAFDLQLNPANPGMQFHKLNAARDPNLNRVIDREAYVSSCMLQVILHTTAACCRVRFWRLIFSVSIMSFS